MHIANAFSLQMLDASAEHNVKIVPVDASEIPPAVESAIGHADTAAVVGNLLNRQLTAQRINISLEKGDVLWVAQLTGGRLPEGATTLPEGFDIKFLRVEVQ